MFCSRNVKIVFDIIFVEVLKFVFYDVVVLLGGVNGVKNFVVVSFLD